MTEGILSRFKTYPFPISPIEKAEIWADMEKLKEKLEKFFIVALSNPPSMSAILYGWRGVGKTYAMKFFTRLDVVQEIIAQRKLKLFIIKVPMQLGISQNPYKYLYIRIMEAIRDELKNTLKEKLSVTAQQYLSDTGFMRRQIKTELSNFIYIDKISTILSKWLEYLIYQKDTLEEKEFKKLRMDTRDIAEEDIPYVVTGLFNFLISSEILRKLLENKSIKIILWIDEWENILDVRQVEFYKINDFIRYLIDYVPLSLALLINLTLKPKESSGDVPKYFTHTVLDRILNWIEIKPLSPDDAIKYVKDRLEYYLKEEEDNPVTEDAIKIVVEKIIKEIGSITPRDLNKAFSIILTEADYRKYRKLDLERTKTILEEIEFKPF